MSAFTGFLTIAEHDVDTDIWELVTPLIWEVDHLGSGLFIVVYPGFVSDGASLPFLARIFFPRWGRKYRRGAVLHDYLCTELNIGSPAAFCPTREHADKIFLEAMAACKVSVIVRYTFFLAVRAYSVFVRRA